MMQEQKILYWPSFYSGARGERCLQNIIGKCGMVKILNKPFSMHNRRKSASVHCNLRMAAVLVMYALAAPDLPFCFNLPMN